DTLYPVEALAPPLNIVIVYVNVAEGLTIPAVALELPVNAFEIVTFAGVLVTETLVVAWLLVMSGSGVSLAAVVMIANRAGAADASMTVAHTISAPTASAGVGLLAHDVCGANDGVAAAPPEPAPATA